MRKREEKYNENNSDGHALAVIGNSRSEKFHGKCNTCGRKGHKSIDCWERPENAHKRPKNWSGSGSSSKGKKEFQGKCFICKKWGHRASECPDKEKKEDMDDFGDLALATKANDCEMNLPSVGKDLWMADSGATSHMRNSLEGMFDLKPSHSSVKWEMEIHSKLR